MHELGKSLFRQVTGQSIEDLVRVPRGREILNKFLREAASQYPLRSVGQASDGELFLSEEDRESHVHVLGAPGEGKSKFIELLVRQDIDAGYGCCVLDPSDGGATVYKLLKYCIKKGVEKVVLIDPHDIYNPAIRRIVTINPLNYDAPANVSVGKVMDTIHVLWGSKHEQTAKIDKYLPAILRALHASKMSLYEALYFTQQFAYRNQRTQMLEMYEHSDGKAGLHPLDRYRVSLESVFVKPQSLFSAEMDSTSRRFEPFFDEVFRCVIGSKQNPLPFADLIADKWVILVNLDRSRVWGSEQQRLLGTMIINEVIDAIDALRAAPNPWRGRYYLYVDEVGQYATRKVAEVLDLKRKTGLSFTVAHQRFNQIEDANVLSAIKDTTKIKVLFNTPSREDRDAMVRMMYGGDIPDREVSFLLSQLQKQHAAIKINKHPPRISRLPDVPDIDVAPAVLASFKQKLYQQEWFKTPTEVLNEINARFTQHEPARTFSKRAAHQRPMESAGEQRPKGKDSRSAPPRTVPDNRPDGPPVLFRKKGRATRKVDNVPPKTDE